MISGGPAFARSIVNDVIRWVKHIEHPAFVIITDWTNEFDHNTNHVSMLIQRCATTQAGTTTTKRRRVDDDSAPQRDTQWCLASVPLQHAAKEGRVKRCKKIDVDHPSRTNFYFRDDADVLKLLRATFELDMWARGAPDTYSFDAYPTLYMLDSDGFLAHVRINKGDMGAITLDDWQGMVGCLLDVIRLLSSGSRPQ